MLSDILGSIFRPAVQGKDLYRNAIERCLLPLSERAGISASSPYIQRLDQSHIAVTEAMKKALEDAEKARLATISYIPKMTSIGAASGLVLGAVAVITGVASGPIGWSALYGAGTGAFAGGAGTFGLSTWNYCSSHSEIFQIEVDFIQTESAELDLAIQAHPNAADLQALKKEFTWVIQKPEEIQSIVTETQAKETTDRNAYRQQQAAEHAREQWDRFRSDNMRDIAFSNAQSLASRR